jgi:hypothetical protein
MPILLRTSLVWLAGEQLQISMTVVPVREANEISTYSFQRDFAELDYLSSCIEYCRSQWPSGLRHELPSSAKMQSSNPFRGMDVCL